MTAVEFVTQLRTAIEAQKSKHSKLTSSDIAKMVDAANVHIGGSLKSGKATVGQSKVGGKPDLPADFEWPCEGDDEDAPLGFVAQINLAEVHAADLGKTLPATGMLWFFSILDGDRAYGHEIDSDTSVMRYEAEPGALKSHKLPELFDDNEDAVIKERVITFGPTVDVDSHDADVHELIEKALKKVGGVKGPVFMNKPSESGDIILASFDGYDIAPNAFGEGFLDFMISPEDLNEGNLDAAVVEFAAGT
ncbi:MAG TPA: DUF1963 domain-containing protein [Kofleriaceae bacterium]|nr:DUF1963 domain-containing protein [Kofleriaceae bacterium]